MAELSNSGCEYCREDRDGYRARFGAFSIANPSHGSVWTISTGHCKPRQIFFCPICGRKLAEPAKELKKNEPLTLEELREMAGEPVWVMHTNGAKQWHIVGEVYEYAGISVVRWKDGGLEPTADCGVTWLAYRRKLEEGDAR